MNNSLILKKGSSLRDCSSTLMRDRTNFLKIFFTRNAMKVNFCIIFFFNEQFLKWNLKTTFYPIRALERRVKCLIQMGKLLGILSGLYLQHTNKILSLHHFFVELRKFSFRCCTIVDDMYELSTHLNFFKSFDTFH